MTIRKLTDTLSVSPQIAAADLPALHAAGIRAIICNRPDGEGPDQPTVTEIRAAAAPLGIDVHYLPVDTGKVTDDRATQFGALVASLEGPVLAYCRSGTRSATLWALSQAGLRPLNDIVATAAAAGYDLHAIASRVAQGGRQAAPAIDARHDIVIVGAGAAGIAVASSLLARDASLDIAMIDPADVHYYQPGWTMVGAGVFRPETTARRMTDVPRGVHRIQAAVAGFGSTRTRSCSTAAAASAIASWSCARAKLDWHGIEGLTDTLGRNGVTSNYRYDLAPYTWELVRAFRGGNALFTQPPMPIKCAGAPQKAMYLSCDHWRRAGRLEAANVEFLNAGAALFGVADYVPALMEYVKSYDIALSFGHNLVSIDARDARRARALPDGGKETVVRAFDMIHVVPPQKAPDFVRSAARRCGRLDRRRSGDAAAQAVPGHLRARRRDQHDQCENGRGRPQAGAGGRAQPARIARPRARRRRVRRLRLVPAHRRARQDRARRVPVRRQGRADLPRVADRRQAPVAARVAAQGARAAAALLEGDAQGPRMACEARDRTLTGSLTSC